MVGRISDRRTLPAGSQIALWHAPDGWPIRVFSWSPPEGVRHRGSILFQGGRGDIFEKYLESFAHWHAQGWSITSFDWRGQGGSGRLSAAGDCGDIADFADYISDLRSFYADWLLSAKGARVVMGHSMGGHLLLRGLVEQAIKPDAAVLIAPMLGLRSALPFADKIAQFMARLGNPSRPAWKSNEKPYAIESRQKLLTHDRDRYEDELFWQREKPEIVTGPPSWRWLVEAFRSTKMLEADPRLSTLTLPVLMLVAKADGLVDPQAALRIARKVLDMRVLCFGKESAHEILRESDAVRDKALGEIDRFLASRAP